MNVNFIDSNIRLVLGVINSISSVAATLGNLLIIVVILYNSRLRTRPNYLICCLAVTDLLIGLVIQPMVAVRLFLKVLFDNCTMAVSVTFIGGVLCGASACILSVISYDRYLHIVKWQVYRLILPKGKLYILITICWVYPILGSLFSLFSSTRMVYYSLLTILSCTVAASVCVFYSRIFMFVRARRKVIQAAKQIATRSNANDQARMQLQVKLATNSAIVIGCFVVCWVPLTVFSIYVAVNDLVSGAPVTPDRSLVAVRYFAVSLGMVNSAINPLIYFWRNTALRVETKTFILQKILRR